jgi:hypothetical protein
MTSNAFYGWQVAWYVFATIASFAAALVFWTKGASAIGGKLTQLGATTWRLSGAAAIFVIVLILFYVVDPLKSLSDYKTVLVIYQLEQAQAKDSKVTARTPVTIRPGEINQAWINLDADTMVVEMVPYESIVSLVPEPNGTSFSTASAIPAGTYRVRVIEKDSGKSKDFKMDVPPSALP